MKFASESIKCVRARCVQLEIVPCTELGQGPKV